MKEENFNSLARNSDPESISLVIISVETKLRISTTISNSQRKSKTIKMKLPLQIGLLHIFKL